LNALTKAMTDSGAVCELVQTLQGDAAIGSRGNGGDEAVLFEGEVGDEIVKLKDEADFVAQETQQIALAVDHDSIHRNAAAIGLIEAAKKMEQRAFATAGWAAESDGLAFFRFEVNALEDGDCPLVIALPHVFRAKDGASAAVRLRDHGAHSKRSASTARMRMA
jgi:hypothetical protein